MKWGNGKGRALLEANIRQPLVLERLEPRILLAADPVAAVDLPDEQFINENFDFAISFDNASATPGDVGFGPFTDLITPAALNLNSASYLGSPVDLVATGFWDGTQWLDAPVGSPDAMPVDEHPFGETIPLPVGAQAGDVWYAFELPFGSFTPDQPTAEIEFSATLDTSAGAQVGTDLGIEVRPGFRFGADPLNNPEVDAPIINTPVTGDVTPTVMTFDKAVLPTETESATGPNHPITYQLTIDIANGETITSIDLRDQLPDNVVYIGGSLNVDTSGAQSASGINIQDEPIAGMPNVGGDADFFIEIGSVTGTTSGTDIVVEYQVFVPDLDAGSADIIDPATGVQTSVTNQASVDGAMHEGAPLPVFNDTDTTFDAKSLAIQKGVSVFGGGPVVPGSILEYTLEFQVSDYFSFHDVMLTDIFSDGQLFVDSDPALTPRFSVMENGVADAGDFNASNFLVMRDSPGTGNTTIEFQLSQQLSVDGTLDGDLFADSTLDGGTSGVITYYTQIQDAFTDSFPSGDDSVDLGDSLTNNVTINSLLPNDVAVSDTSSASVTIDEPLPSKSIFAIGGDRNFSNATISPGQTITYRLALTLPAGDVEALRLTDFLPLPVFEATQLTGGSAAAGVAGLIGAFDAMNPIPAAGEIRFGAWSHLASDGLSQGRRFAVGSEC